jgi:hypothetical protein
MGRARSWEIPMVWVVEKKVFHHVVSLGFEYVDIPVRVKFEFEVKDGSLVPESLSTHSLYNQEALRKRYPGLDATSLESSIGKTVDKEIIRYLRECGFLNGENNFGVGR